MAYRSTLHLLKLAPRVSARFLQQQPCYNPPKRFASAVSGSSVLDPAPQTAAQLFGEGTSALQDGDLELARSKLEKSLQVSADNAPAWYNLGVAHYQSNDLPSAIKAFDRSLSLSPSADGHCNLASAYIMGKPPNPEKALYHLKSAIELAPEDGEIRFNLAVVLESASHFEEALREYTKAKDMGVQRAEQSIRNVGAKLLRQRVDKEQATNPKK